MLDVYLLTFIFAIYKQNYQDIFYLFSYNLI